MPIPPADVPYPGPGTYTIDIDGTDSDYPLWGTFSLSPQGGFTDAQRDEFFQALLDAVAAVAPLAVGRKDYSANVIVTPTEEP